MGRGNAGGFRVRDVGSAERSQLTALKNEPKGRRRDAPLMRLLRYAAVNPPVFVVDVGEEKLALSFIKLFDSSTTLRLDDRAEAKSGSKEEWEKYVGPGIMDIAYGCLAIINAAARRPRTLNYNQQYIGLTDNGRPNNSVEFSPLKSRMKLEYVFPRLSPG